MTRTNVETNNHHAKMICEVANALFITYIATEYLTLSTNGSHTHTRYNNNKASPHRRQHLQLLWQSPTTKVATILITIVNIVSRLPFDHLLSASPNSSVIINASSSIIQRTLHAPRILLAAVVFILALYYDCRCHVRAASPMGHVKNLSPLSFLKVVAVVNLRLMPIYPFLVVIMAFLFSFAVSFWEAVVPLPIELLNAPVYYGVLYGPLGTIYWGVKRRIKCGDYGSGLPIVTSEM